LLATQDKFQDASENLEPGLALAYGMLVLMAIIPIYVGSSLSIKHMPSKDKEKSEVGDMFILV
jgi:hypothetical protein